MKTKIALIIAACMVVMTPAVILSVPGPKEPNKEGNGGNPNNGNNGNDKDSGNAQGEKKPKGPGHNE
tara:strand:- start:957 stop:1157 length:201 start_codon:yes stop_codon:yes gene_type:complete